MRKGTRLWLPLLLVLLGTGAGKVQANTFLEMQSIYLGGGWFQYQMQVQNDPFFTEADVTELVINFTNQIDQGTNPDNWTDNWTNSDIDVPSSTWTCNTNYPSRPYEVTFLLRSSETAYKVGAATNLNGAVAVVSLSYSVYNPYYDPEAYSQNVVGYAMMPCLIPCRPDEADGSPTNFVYDLKLVPDILINQLIQTDGVFDGVDFNWDAESTFLLQGTVDFNSWTNVAYIWSYPPETTWTTNRPLSDYGQFFRLAMVAGWHSTNLPPLNANVALAPKASVKTGNVLTTPRVTGCRPANGKMVVSIAAQPNQTCVVQVMDSHRVVLQTRQVTTTGTSAAVDFDAASLPNSVFFQVVPVQ